MVAIISVSQQKGGVGKTTIVTNLAVVWQNLGKKVLIIDADPQATTSIWFSLRKDKYNLNLVQQRGWKVTSEISQHRFDYDIIIIDSPPHAEDSAKTLIRVSNLVLIPLQASSADVWATERTIEFCNQEEVPYQVVINRGSANQPEIPQVKERFANVVETTLGNRIAYQRALARGLSVIETERNKPASQEIIALADYTLSTLEKLKALAN